MTHPITTVCTIRFTESMEKSCLKPQRREARPRCDRSRHHRGQFGRRIEAQSIEIVTGLMATAIAGIRTWIMLAQGWVVLAGSRSSLAREAQADRKTLAPLEPGNQRYADHPTTAARRPPPAVEPGAAPLIRGG